MAAAEQWACAGDGGGAPRSPASGLSAKEFSELLYQVHSTNIQQIPISSYEDLSPWVTASHPNCEDKHCRARLVLRWRAGGDHTEYGSQALSSPGSTAVGGRGGPYREAGCRMFCPFGPRVHREERCALRIATPLAGMRIARCYSYRCTFGTTRLGRVPNILPVWATCPLRGSEERCALRVASPLQHVRCALLRRATVLYSYRCTFVAAPDLNDKRPTHVTD